MRTILGFPFILFFPSYALMAALFPKKGRIGSIERVALSFGMSIAMISLIGLILNYTAWGIRLESILYSTASFMLIISVIIKGLSSSGKSYVLLRVLNLFPKTAYSGLTDATLQSFVYSDEKDFDHKILIMLELPGMEKANYSIRTL